MKEGVRVIPQSRTVEPLVESPEDDRNTDIILEWTNAQLFVTLKFGGNKRWVATPPTLFNP